MTTDGALAPAAAGSGPPPDDVVLEVRDLRTRLQSRRSAEPVDILRSVRLRLRARERLALVGESASGKSMTALSVMRLLDTRASHVTGEVWVNGRDVLQLPEEEMRRVRGGEVSMIFQDPMTALNPVMTVGDQIVEAIRLHRRATRAEGRRRARGLLDDVRIANAERRLDAYPHEFSGGMRQRVMIAMALSTEPSVVLADEPTTALDVTIQAQVMRLLVDLAEAHKTAVVLITHDLGLVAGFADVVAVMYAGRIVELGLSRDVFRRPVHPYTEGLLASVPRLDQDPHGDLRSIGGSPPQPGRLPAGCPFHPRCPAAEAPRCVEEVPPEIPVTTGAAIGLAECHFAEERQRRSLASERRRPREAKSEAAGLGEEG